MKLNEQNNIKKLEILREKDLTLKAANYMYNRFKELGVPVALQETRILLYQEQKD